MFCKKCGNEIKEGNVFCTNCGTPIEITKINKKTSNNNTENEKNTNNKTEMKKKSNKLKVMITIIMIGIIIICIAITVFLKSKDKEVINNNNEVTENIEQEKIYITQDSDISPTGKEFVGVFSDKLAKLYKNEEEGNIAVGTVTYNTSIKNILQYSYEGKYINNVTKEKNTAFDIVYYYNSTNNHLIGSRNTIYMLEEIFNGDETLLHKKIPNFVEGSLNVFMNYHNMEEEEKNSQEQQDKFSKYQEYVTMVTNQNCKNLVFDNYICDYTIIGIDSLYVCTRFNDDNNKIEFLVLAYDENITPEETIKNWYNTVYTKDEISQTEENLLDEIYTKYPELENADIPICKDEERKLLVIR